MNQYPNQPPYQPSNQQYYQQQPYQPSNQPYYQQPFQAPLPPQRPPTLWQKFRSRSRRFQWGIGCGTMLFALVACSMCSLVVNAATPAASQTARVSTTTVTNNTQTPTNPAATSTTGYTATPAPTTQPKPIVTPTKPPEPTTRPTPRPTAKPTSKPTAPPQPTAKPRPTSPPQPTGVNGNPWGYNFNAGNLIYSPNANFCAYFKCIANFWNGRGFVNECVDGDYSKSGGIQGDCSHHGGESQPLYSH